MVIVRNVPAEHVVSGFIFHHGAQFVSDAFYYSNLKDNLSFKKQIDVGHLIILVEAKPMKDGKINGKACTSLADEIQSLSADKAIQIIKKTIDGIDLSEVCRLDKRADVVRVAQKQIEDRQMTMNGLTPREMAQPMRTYAGQMMPMTDDREINEAAGVFAKASLR